MIIHKNSTAASLPVSVRQVTPTLQINHFTCTAFGTCFLFRRSCSTLVELIQHQTLDVFKQPFHALPCLGARLVVKLTALNVFQKSVGCVLQSSLDLKLVLSYSKLHPLAAPYLPAVGVLIHQVYLGPNDHSEAVVHGVLQEWDEDFLQLVEAGGPGEIKG